MCGIKLVDALGAVEEIDRILALLGESTSKADPNILTAEGFDAWATQYAARVLKAVSPADKKAVARMVAKLDQPWSRLSEAKQARLIERAMGEIALGAAAETKVVKEIQLNYKAVIATTKAAAKNAYSQTISAAYSAVDRKAVAYAGKSQTHFIRNAYGNRQVALSEQARRTVAKGMAQGLDSAAIGEKLSKQMEMAGLLRSRAYWNTVSSIFSARGRAYGLANSYEQAKIEMARITAIQDEVTTEQCNFLHDKLVPVKGAMDQYRKVGDSADPEAVVNEQPFVRLGKNSKGVEQLYINKDGKRQVIADVLKAARGEKDNASAGQYNQRMSDADMQSAGVGFPPYHAFCRTITVPA